MNRISQRDYQKGDHIFLEGKTRRGKNKIHEEGPDFVIKNISDTVSFNTSGNPPYLLLSSTKNPNKQRWVAVNNDPHFEIKR